MISIKDVAKKAGVAKSTVSKVLNHYELVSEETREKVELAIKELGYIPNYAAVSLSKKKVLKVGLIIDINYYRQAIDEIDIQYLFGAFEKSKEFGTETVTFFTSQFVQMNAEEIIRYLQARGITGFIVYGIAKDNMHLFDVIMSKEFKVVLVDSPLADEKISSVSLDHYAAQYEVAKKTLENVKRDVVLYLGGGMGGYATDPRLSAMRRLQQQEKFELIVKYAGYSEKKAREITFERGRDVDAIICASDLMAIGACYALQEMGISKPVSGYDGIKLLGYIKASVYTVKQDFYKISMIAFEEWMHLEKGERGRHVTVEHDIIQVGYLDVIV